MGKSLVDVSNCLAEQPGHLCDHRVRGTGHHFRLDDEIPRVVEDAVDSTGQREHVLGLQRGHEGRAQRVQQRSLGRVAAVLRVAHQRRGAACRRRPTP